MAGALAARGGVLFIDRDGCAPCRTRSPRSPGSLRGGAAVAAFPEGSTWCGRARGHFRRAVFQAALDARSRSSVRIGYRGVRGTPATARAFVGDDTLLASLWRVASAREWSPRSRCGLPSRRGATSTAVPGARGAAGAVTGHEGGHHE
ncbi:hypothetical protein GCM10023238_00400 [Streptomyces heliomycini]